MSLMNWYYVHLKIARSLQKNYFLSCVFFFLVSLLTWWGVSHVANLEKMGFKKIKIRKLAITIVDHFFFEIKIKKI